MKSFPVIAALFVLAGIPSAVWAQNPAQPVPHNPILRRAPAFASWTITFSHRERDAAKANPRAAARTLEDRIVSLTVTKTNKTYQEQTLWSSGKKTESWISDNVFLQMSPDGRSIIPTPLPIASSSPGEQAELHDYSKSDFGGLQWLSTQHYKGVEKYQGVTVFRFDTGMPKAPARVGAENSVPQPSPGKVAYLTVDTQLPLYSDDGDVECTYIYHAPPSSPLVLPARFAEVVKNMKEGHAYRHSRPSPP